MSPTPEMSAGPAISLGNAERDREPVERGPVDVGLHHEVQEADATKRDQDGSVLALDELRQAERRREKYQTAAEHCGEMSNAVADGVGQSHYA